jgi:phage host-nuclease inhibitor protein Gam
MTEESTPHEVVIPVPKNIQQLDELLKQKQRIKTQFDDAKSKTAAIKANMQSLEDAIIIPLVAVDDAINVAIEAYLHTHRSSIRRKFGRTVTLTHGVIKWFVRRSFDLPKDEKPVIAVLLGIRGGKKYLNITYQVNETALSQAPKSLLLRLRPFGVGNVRYEHLNVTVTGQKQPIKLSRRRYFGPLSQRKK